MKEHLENRIKELEKEYNVSLTLPANSGGEITDAKKQIQWCDTACIRAKLMEVRELLAFFKENNYTNL